MLLEAHLLSHLTAKTPGAGYASGSPSHPFKPTRQHLMHNHERPIKGPWGGGLSKNQSCTYERETN